jgi:ligand-binding sensor domain-containing protein
MTRSSLLMLGLMPLMALSQPFQWTTFTSTSNTVDLISYEGSIWTATSGGLSVYDVDNDQFDVYTNTRGLAMNQTTAVGYDDRGWIWVALTDGRITRINPETGQVRQIVALEGEVFDVYRILNVGASVFVAANNGIYRFEYNDIPDNYIVRESIKVLGGFPSEAEVLDIAANEGYLYAATTHGLARAELTNEFLGAPASWENITTANSNLPQNHIRRLFNASDGKLWLAGPQFTYSYNGTDFRSIVQFNDPIQGFAETDNGMFAATEFWVFEFTENNWLGIGYQINSIIGLTTIEIENEKRLVVGVGDSDARSGGILLFDPDNPGEPVHAPGIGGNQISRVKLDEAGDLWVTTNTDRKGVSRYDGSEWHQIIQSAEYNHEYFTDDPRNVAFDKYGGVWVASQGGGVLWLAGI